ncbi:MAG: serine/threonine-protein kinase [Xanthomonadales bacterium]|nr:serine/threonine-protein kinase [Xanthomonadales bacterium]
MDPRERWNLLQSLFDAAREQTTAGRQHWLEQQLAGKDMDPDQARGLVTELLQMLQAHDGPPLEMEQGVGDAEAPPLPERLGSYRILSRIARGGMGEVLLAERDDDTFQRQVAIKILTRRSGAGLGHGAGRGAWISRFQREQQIHARLEHPNIARLLDAGVTPDDLPFLVMEYVDGQNIVEYVQHQALSLGQRVDLMVQVCNAVSFAHNQLILHRDIKPSNVLITGAGEARLLDFGIAKLLDESDENPDLTRPGDRLMTPRYASPEQVRGEALAVTSDVYSLGVVLYELLTGQLPYTATGSYELSEQIVHQEARPPQRSDLNDAIPADLQAICLKALDKEPSRRYPSAAALASDLQRYRSHRSISARRPGLLDRAGRVLRRNPVAAPLSVLAVVAIISGGTMAAWQAREAARERDVARAERDRAEQVTEVLVDLFDSDPFAESENRRDDITLREFLTGRAGELGPQLDGQPALKATLYNLFANLLSNLSLLEEAEPYAEEALAISRELYQGRPHEDVAKSLDTLATLRQNQGRFEQAEQLFRECLAMRERLYPETHPLVSTSVNNLAVVLYHLDSPEHEEESLALDHRAMNINIQRFGADSLEAAQNYNNLGAFYVARKQPGDLDKALPLLQRSLDIRMRELGSGHPSTINSTSNLANLMHDLGRLEAADQLFVQALDGTRRAIGPRHTRVADVLYGRGHLLMDQQRWAEAEQAFAESLSIYRDAVPADHPYIAETLVELGHAQAGSGQALAAAGQFQQAAEVFAVNNDSEFPRLESLFFQARALAQAGDRERSTRLAREVLLQLPPGQDFDRLRSALEEILADPGQPAEPAG